MSSFRPLVSIIINTHNNLRYLPETIANAYQQTYQNFEIILYDNASTEDVQSLADKYDEKFKYFRSEEFLTLGQARNKALQEAKGEIIDFLDSDDLFDPQKLEKMVPYFEDSDVGLVTCNTYIFKDLPNGDREQRLMHTRPIESGLIFRHQLKEYRMSFVATMIRSSEIGLGFPESFNICTDFDLFLRIIHKKKVIYVDEPLSFWRSTGENWSIKRRYLTPIEQQLMIHRMMEYEPDLAKKYPQEMKAYFEEIHNQQYHYYWEIGLCWQAWSQAVSAFVLSGKLKHLIKILFIPFFSRDQFENIKYRITGRHYRQL